MRLYEAINIFLKRASSDIPTEALERAKTLVSAVASAGAENADAYNKVFSNSFANIDEFVDFINSTLKPQVKQYVPNQLSEIDFILNLVHQPIQKAEKPQVKPEQITDWVISQLNNLKSKISTSGFTGFSVPEAEKIVGFVHNLKQRLPKASPGSSEANKIKNTLEIVSAFSEDIFPEPVRQKFKNVVSTMSEAEKALESLKPTTEEPMKLKLAPETGPISPKASSKVRLNLLKKFTKK